MSACFETDDDIEVGSIFGGIVIVPPSSIFLSYPCQMSTVVCLQGQVNLIVSQQ